MSNEDEPTSPRGSQGSPGSPGSPGDSPIPLEPLLPTPEMPIARPSVLRMTDDKCPNCGASMDANAVVCMACGYDLKANEILRPQTGVEYIEPAPSTPDRPEFIKPG